MSRRRVSLLEDLSGVFRGLYVIKQNANMLQNQRPISFKRNLTDAQRQAFRQQREMREFERQLERENEMQEEQLRQMTFEQTDEKVNADKEHKMAESTQDLSNTQEMQKNTETKVEAKQPETRSYKASPDIGNRLYNEQLQKEQVQKQSQTKSSSDDGTQARDEIGESTFGKGQHQQETKYDSDTPFFMRQDRPKFSTQERYVPSSAASRALHFGMLGVQLVGGTMAEAIKQKVGLSSEIKDQQGKQGIAKYAINEKNANRLASNFKKMRGGALKIGQIMSTSEESVLPPIIRDAMEKARSEADIMPLKQVTQNLIREYGQDWQKNFKEINLYPFAAASIGQVHEALLKDGTRIAMKMQYTGIANSVDSDLNNFKRIIDMLGIFPRGLYLNEAIDVARQELHWECNYEREATYQRAYRQHLLKYPNDFYCPKVIDDLSSRTILCSEFVDGREIDTFMDAPQEVRNRIGSLLISLCFKELFEFKMMQTDPNPANYLFDEEQNILNLLDLGAGRDFEDHFLDSYLQIIWGAYKEDRDAILHNSQNIGFLTGEENKEMLNAHCEGTLIVGEPFRTPKGELYDFGAQGLTAKVYRIMPTMSKHRLAPPPQEVYSLHKKIIGAYLMCIKLRAQVPAREILEEVRQEWALLWGKQFFAKR